MTAADSCSRFNGTMSADSLYGHSRRRSLFIGLPLSQLCQPSTIKKRPPNNGDDEAKSKMTVVEVDDSEETRRLERKKRTQEDMVADFVKILEQMMKPRQAITSFISAATGLASVTTGTIYVYRLPDAAVKAREISIVLIIYGVLQILLATAFFVTCMQTSIAVSKGVKVSVLGTGPTSEKRCRESSSQIFQPKPSMISKVDVLTMSVRAPTCGFLDFEYCSDSASFLKRMCGRKKPKRAINRPSCHSNSSLDKSRGQTHAKRAQPVKRKFMRNSVFQETLFCLYPICFKDAFQIVVGLMVALVYVAISLISMVVGVYGFYKTLALVSYVDYYDTTSTVYSPQFLFYTSLVVFVLHIVLIATKCCCCK
ncbi:hypothetical protein OSTOST_24152 [Ostertagia ostertagi]